MASPQTSKIKSVVPAKRSRAGCLTCRTRRVKCDETPGECMRCRNLSVVCRWEEKRDIVGSRGPSRAKQRKVDPPYALSTSPRESTLSQPADAELDPMETGMSVTPTATAFQPASSPSVGSVTTSVPATGGPHVPLHGRRSTESTTAPLPLATPPPLGSLAPSLPNTTGISRSDLTRHINAFFAHVYPVQGMSFIHRGTLTREIASGTAPPILVKAISAVSARFLEDADPAHPDGGDRAARWADEVKMLLIIGTDRLSLAKLAATLCLVHHEFNSGRLVSASTYVTLASRFAFFMELHVEPVDSDLPWTSRETRRRLMWATFCADCLFAGGSDLFTGCKAEYIDVALPCSETHFNFGPPVVAPKLSEAKTVGFEGTEQPGPAAPCPSPDADGFMSRWIRLMDIRSDLLKLTKHSHQLVPRPWEPGSLFDSLLARLSHWRATLPPELELTTDNLYAYSGSPGFSSLVTIHLFYDQFQAAVYRSTLHFDDGTIPKDFLDSAPRPWLDEVRTLAYIRCCEMVDKLEVLEREFSDWIPPTRMWNLLSMGILQGILSYLSLRAAGKISQEQSPPIDRARTQPSLELVLGFVARMTRYFKADGRVYRDLLRLAWRNGYHIDPQLDVFDAFTSGSRSPAPGMLPHLQWLRNSVLRHPPLEDNVPETCGKAPSLGVGIRRVGQATGETVAAKTGQPRPLGTNAPPKTWPDRLHRPQLTEEYLSMATSHLDRDNTGQTFMTEPSPDVDWSQPAEPAADPGQAGWSIFDQFDDLSSAPQLDPLGFDWPSINSLSVGHDVRGVMVGVEPEPQMESGAQLDLSQPFNSV